MSQSFDINPPVTRLKVEAGSSARVSFPVTNRLGRKVDAHFQVKTSNAMASPWLSIDGEAVRTLQADQTEPVLVAIQVPREATSAGHAFSLRVSNVADTANEFEVSPEVSFDVTPKPITESKPNYTWLWLAVGVVVIIGGGVGAYFLGAKPGYGEKCKDDCEAGLTCVGAEQARTCLRAPGQTCGQGAECATAICEASKCIAGLPWSTLFPNTQLECPNLLTAANLESGKAQMCHVKVGTRNIEVSGTLKNGAMALTGHDAVDPAGCRFEADSARVTVAPGGVTWSGKVYLTKELVAADQSEAARDTATTVAAARDIGQVEFASNTLKIRNNSVLSATLMNQAVIFMQSAVTRAQENVRNLEAQVQQKQRELTEAQQVLAARQAQVPPNLGALGSLFGATVTSSFEAQVNEARARVSSIANELAVLKTRLQEARTELQQAQQLEASEAAKRAAEQAQRQAEAAKREAEAKLAVDKTLSQPLSVTGKLENDGSYALASKSKLTTPYVSGELAVDITPKGASASFHGRLCTIPFADPAGCYQVDAPVKPNGSVCSGNACADVLHLHR